MTTVAIAKRSSNKNNNNSINITFVTVDIENIVKRKISI